MTGARRADRHPERAARLLPLVALCLLGYLASPAAGKAHAASPAAVLRIAYTAELRGNLQPCSCPANPLGGLARRIGFLDSLRTAPDPAPLLVLDAGRMLPERDRFPRLPAGAFARLQDLTIEAAAEASYDAILSDDGSIPDARWIPPLQARRVEIAGKRIGICALEERFDPLEAREAVGALGRVDLLILLCSADLHYAMRAAKLLGARAAIVARGADFDRPVLLDGVLFFGPGRDGRHTGYARIEVRRGEAPRVLEGKLRAMDGSTPVDPQWQDRVERLLLEIDQESPGALAWGE